MFENFVDRRIDARAVDVGHHRFLDGNFLRIGIRQRLDQMQIALADYADELARLEYGQMTNVMLPHQAMRLSHERVLADRPRLPRHVERERRHQHEIPPGVRTKWLHRACRRRGMCTRDAQPCSSCAVYSSPPPPQH
jgi:hypothetical protein